MSGSFSVMFVMFVSHITSSMRIADHTVDSFAVAVLLDKLYVPLLFKPSELQPGLFEDMLRMPWACPNYTTIPKGKILTLLKNANL